MVSPGLCQVGTSLAATASHGIVLARGIGGVAGGAKKNSSRRQVAALTLGEANKLVARLGGYSGRKGDGEPGAESIGLGLRRLIDMTWGWRLRQQAEVAR